MWHGYFGIENLGLNLDQRTTLMSTLQALGPGSNPQPARLCHWRIRLDDDAAIFEALLNENNLTIIKFKKWLADIFDAPMGTINHDTTNQVFDTLDTTTVTFSRSGTDYLRVAFFGYDGNTWPTWRQSGDECRAYLAANLAEWEE